MIFKSRFLRNQEDVSDQIFVAYSRALAHGFDFIRFPDSDSPAHRPISRRVNPLTSAAKNP